MNIQVIGSAVLVAILGLCLGGCGEPTPATEQTHATPAMNAAPAVLVTGAKISGANGMAFSKDGLLYVASVLGSEMIVLNPDTGQVVKRFTRADGVEGPDDVAFAADGAFYWTSILTGEVAGFRADGSRVTAARLTAGVNPITFSDDGRLFVAQCFFGDKLYEVDPNGIKEARLISDKLGPRCGLNGMDWGPDGRLYGPRWFRGEVVSFDVFDISSIVVCVVLAKLPEIERYEVVYDGAVFGYQYEGSSVTAIVNGLHFECVRTDGWPVGVTFKTIAVNTGALVG